MKRILLVTLVGLLLLAGYLLWPREKDLGDARRYHPQMVLTEDTEENRRDFYAMIRTVRVR